MAVTPSARSQVRPALGLPVALVGTTLSRDAATSRSMMVLGPAAVTREPRWRMQQHITELHSDYGDTCPTPGEDLSL